MAVCFGLFARRTAVFAVCIASVYFAAAACNDKGTASCKGNDPDIAEKLDPICQSIATSDCLDQKVCACACRSGYAGAECDRCAPGYIGFPSCTACSWHDFILADFSNAKQCGRYAEDINAEYCSAFVAAHVLSENECLGASDSPCRQAHSLKATAYALYIINLLDFILEAGMLLPVTVLTWLELKRRRQVSPAGADEGRPAHINALLGFTALCFGLDCILQIAALVLASGSAHDDAGNVYNAGCMNEAGSIEMAKFQESIKFIRWMGGVELFIGVVGTTFEATLIFNEDPDRGCLVVFVQFGLAALDLFLTSAEFFVFTLDAQSNIDALFSTMGGGLETNGIRWCVDSVSISRSDCFGITSTELTYAQQVPTSFLVLGICAACVICCLALWPLSKTKDEGFPFFDIVVGFVGVPSCCFFIPIITLLAAARGNVALGLGIASLVVITLHVVYSFTYIFVHYRTNEHPIDKPLLCFLACGGCLSIAAAACLVANGASD